MRRRLAVCRGHGDAGGAVVQVLVPEIDKAVVGGEEAHSRFQIVRRWEVESGYWFIVPEVRGDALLKLDELDVVACTQQPP